MGCGYNEIIGTGPSMKELDPSGSYFVPKLFLWLPFYFLEAMRWASTTHFIRLFCFRINTETGRQSNIKFKTNQKPTHTDNKQTNNSSNKTTTKFQDSLFK